MRLNPTDIIAVLVPNNPRQEQTHGHYAFNLYRPGISVAEYLAAPCDRRLPIRWPRKHPTFTGPHRRHLEWDVEHGFVALLPQSVA
jgi:hypothetical protein